MNGVELASLIAASAFVVLVIFLIYTLIKINRTIDSSSATIRATGESLIPLLDNLTETTAQTNRQLAKIDLITDNVVDATSNLSSLINNFTTTIGGPLLRVGEIIKMVTNLIGKKKK
jgi:uncharacterized protein YoxC